MIDHAVVSPYVWLAVHRHDINRNAITWKVKLNQGSGIQSNPDDQ